jgi:hypothetical protein
VCLCSAVFVCISNSEPENTQLTGPPSSLSTDQHQPLASFAARLAEGMPAEPNNNISDYLRSSSRRLYPGYGIDANLELNGTAIQDSLNLRNFSGASSGQATTPQNSAAAIYSMLLQQQQAAFESGQNSDRRPPNNFNGNLPWGS